MLLLLPQLLLTSLATRHVSLLEDPKTIHPVATLHFYAYQSSSTKFANSTPKNPSEVSSSSNLLRCPGQVNRKPIRKDKTRVLVPRRGSTYRDLRSPPRISIVPTRSKRVLIDLCLTLPRNDPLFLSLARVHATARANRGYLYIGRSSSHYRANYVRTRVSMARSFFRKAVPGRSVRRSANRLLHHPPSPSTFSPLTSEPFRPALSYIVAEREREKGKRDRDISGCSRKGSPWSLPAFYFVRNTRAFRLEVPANSGPGKRFTRRDARVETENPGPFCLNESFDGERTRCARDRRVIGIDGQWSCEEGAGKLFFGCFRIDAGIYWETWILRVSLKMLVRLGIIVIGVESREDRKSVV